MHNVKRFLEDSSYIFTLPSILISPPQKMLLRTLTRSLRPRYRRGQSPDDLITIYRKRTTIDSSEKEIVTRLTYFVVDSMETLFKFGTDARERVGLCDYHWPGVAV